MIYRILIVSLVAGVIAAQNFGNNNFIPCGFVCTRNAAFTIIMDGVNTRATCSDSNADLNARCNSCCQSYAMWGGILASNAAGFPSSDGRTCVCCVNNNICGDRHLIHPLPYSLSIVTLLRMIYRILAVTFLAGFIAAQNFGGQSFGNNFIPCGFVCTRTAAFTTTIDGVNTRATCSDSNADVNVRCNSCCQSYALWGGLSTSNAAGFPASDGRTCVCCVNNNQCRGR
ncbi:hypothetical protein PRIPAC_70705 [Pristionchus pacificus]|uniref:Uncharacterized protein n=1 Tax=Pristionchus pacificus TaxID=54126 RepID=A0A2A6CAF5_PRIPA|nr:hypothetical protein PRIPAC_70705 [Pristionchus pacificus]|eukprot:PDM75164.1 hypothetical protein PRIPAC_40545 [Pristionchus pacificus]